VLKAGLLVRVGILFLLIFSLGVYGAVSPDATSFWITAQSLPGGQIKIQWMSLTTDSEPLGYRLFSGDGTTFHQIANITDGSTVYVDTPIVNNDGDVVYYYIVPYDAENTGGYAEYGYPYHYATAACELHGPRIVATVEIPMQAEHWRPIITTVEIEVVDDWNDTNYRYDDYPISLEYSFNGSFNTTFMVDTGNTGSAAGGKIVRAYLDMRTLGNGDSVAIWFNGVDYVGNEIESQLNPPPTYLVDDKCYFIIDTDFAAITSAKYYDENNNGMVDAGDRVVILMDEAVTPTIANPAPADCFELLPSGTATFGTGASMTITTGDSSTTFEITLGAGAVLNVSGVYVPGSTNGPTGINVRPGAPLQDSTKPDPNPAAPMATAKDISTDAEEGPYVTKAYFVDLDSNGVDAGDQLFVVFNQNIQVNGSLGPTAFDLPVYGDTFQIDSYYVNGQTLEITVAEPANLKVAGTYNIGMNIEGSPSGIRVSPSMPAGLITNLLGYDAQASNPVDIDSTDSVAAYPIFARFLDAAGDGPSKGDTVEIGFSEAVYPQAGANVGDFLLQGYGGYTFGAGAYVTQHQTQTLEIVLGDEPFLAFANLNVEDGGINAVNALAVNLTTTGGANYEDLAGNQSQPAAADVSVVSGDTTAPQLISAVFRDLDGNGPDAGDVVILTFSERIALTTTVTAPTAADFNVINGNLGANPTFALGQTTIEITLDAGTVINLFGANTTEIGLVTPNSIRDTSGNEAVGTVYIASDDFTGPILQSARFFDNVNTPGVGAGDTIELVFDEPVTFTDGIDPATVFYLTSGSSFGTGAQMHASTAVNVVEIVLGDGASIQVMGIAGTDPGASGINVLPSQTALTDVAGNRAQTLADWIDVTAGSPHGATLEAAYFEDLDGNGPDEGDKLYFVFSENVEAYTDLAQVDSADFLVHQGSLGTSPQFSLNGNTVEVTLGVGAYLNNILADGMINPTAASVEMANPNDIYNFLGEMAVGATDVVSIDDEGPYVIRVIYRDTHNPLGLSESDEVYIYFNEYVTYAVDTTTGRANLTEADFVIEPTGAPYTFGVGAQFWPEGDSAIKVVLGENPSLEVYGEYNSTCTAAGCPAGVRLNDAGLNITDLSGNPPAATGAVDVTVEDGVNPKLLHAIFYDENGNYAVDSGDKIKLVFDEAVKIINDSVVDSDFVIPVANDTIGSGAQFSADASSEEVVWLTLGAGCRFRIDGVFNPSSTAAGYPSGLDVSTDKIRDYAGNPAYGVGVVDIEPSDTTSPVLIGCRFIDTDMNGVDEGDQLVLIFDEPIEISGLVITDFELPVTGDSFGAGATAVAGATSREILITLGTGAHLNPEGYFDPTRIYEGAPSGIGVLTTDHIKDKWGNSVVFNGYVDVDSGQGPILLTATFEDRVSDGWVGTGDVIILTFNEPVKINGNFDFSGVQLPVSGDSLGLEPTIEVGPESNQITIVLGTNPVVTVMGSYEKALTNAGSPSGIKILPTSNVSDMVDQLSIGNIADIAGNDGTSPQLVTVEIEDLDGNGVDEGDKLYLMFNEPVIPTFIHSSYLVLPVSADTLGSGFTWMQDPTSYSVVIIRLGSLPRLNPDGVFDAANTTAGSPSGLGVVPNLPLFTINDIYGNPPEGGTVIDIAWYPSPEAELIGATYEDVDGNGLDSGDKLILTFTRAVTVDVAILPSDAVVLPVTDDTLGDGAAWESYLGYKATVAIILGDNPTLTVMGEFDPAVVTPGSPSGIGIALSNAFTAYNGAHATSPVYVDVTAPFEKGPRLMQALYYDLDLNGPSNGDLLVLKFDQDVQIPALPADPNQLATLPVAMDSFGTGAWATYGVNVDTGERITSEVAIVLGTGAKLNLEGTYNPANVTDPTAPSGAKVETVNSLLRNFYGKGVETSEVDIEDGLPTTLIRALWEDRGDVGVSSQDRLILRFNRPVNFVGNPDYPSLYLTYLNLNPGAGARLEPYDPANPSPATQFVLVFGDGASANIPPIYPSDPSASAIALREGQVGFVDAANGIYVETYATVDIVASDSVALILTFAGFVDRNGVAGAQEGDQVILTFNKAVYLNGAGINDFDIKQSSDSFGAATITGGPNANQLTITLGAGVSIEVGVTAVDVSSDVTTNGHIKDYAGNNAVPSGYKVITDAVGPYIVRAIYNDPDGNGVGAGDTLEIVFSEAITATGLSSSDFILPVAGDSLGSSPTFSQPAPDRLIITLGLGAHLTVKGVYSNLNLGRSNPSGIKLNPAGVIRDVAGNAPVATGAVDIEGAPPALLLQYVHFVDKFSNGVTPGDELILGFNKRVILDRENVSISDFVIGGGNFGTGARVLPGAESNEVIILLGENATIESIADPAGSWVGVATSVLTNYHLYDTNGNPAQPATRDIEVIGDAVSPQLIGATYYDTAVPYGSVNQGDTLILTFSEPVEIRAPVDTAQFFLAVTGDSLGGTGFSVSHATKANQIEVTLGSGCALTPAGTYDTTTPPPQPAGAPSGINLAMPLTSITDYAGNSAVPAVNPVDITMLDVTPPHILSMRVVNSDGKENVVKPNGDTISFTVQTDDTTLSTASFVADFSQIGGPAASHPDTCNAGTATWNNINTGALTTATAPIIVRVTDMAGNTATATFTVNVIKAAYYVKGEITPSYVPRNRNVTVELKLRPRFVDESYGIDLVNVQLPNGYSCSDVTKIRVTTYQGEWTVKTSMPLDSNQYEVLINTAGNMIQFVFSQALKWQNTDQYTINFEMPVHTKYNPDMPDGTPVVVSVDNTALNSALNVEEEFPGSLILHTEGLEVKKVLANSVIESTGWRIYFTILFNMIPNLSNLPTVRVKLQNGVEFKLRTIQFAEKTYSGSVFIPFSYAEGASTFELWIEGATEPDGYPMANYGREFKLPARVVSIIVPVYSAPKEYYLYLKSPDGVPQVTMRTPASTSVELNVKNVVSDVYRALFEVAETGLYRFKIVVGTQEIYANNYLVCTGAIRGGSSKYVPVSGLELNFNGVSYPITNLKFNAVDSKLLPTRVEVCEDRLGDSRITEFWHVSGEVNLVADQKFGLCVASGESLFWMGKHVSGEGDVAVALDEKAPHVEVENFEDKLVVRVGDDVSGVDVVRLTVGNSEFSKELNDVERWRTVFHMDTRSERTNDTLLVSDVGEFSFDGMLPGYYDVKWQVCDAAGNCSVGVKSILWRGVDDAKVICYPNPVTSDYLKIKLTRYGLDIEKAKVVIYDAAGEKVWSTEVQFYNNEEVVEWRLESLWGSKVKRGVYVVKAKFYSSTGKVLTRYFKVFVAR